MTYVLINYLFFNKKNLKIEVFILKIKKLEIKNK